MQKIKLWHFGGCLNKRAARLRLAVQAPAITTDQSETQRARERAAAAEPLGRRRDLPVRQALRLTPFCMQPLLVIGRVFLPLRK